MRWITSNFSTRGKLIFTFGAIWIVIMLMIGNMYIQSSKIWDAQSDLYNDHYMKEKTLQKITSELNGLRAATLDLLLDTSPGSTAEWKSDIAQRFEAVDKGLGSLAALHRSSGGDDFLRSIQKLGSMIATYRSTLLDEVVPAIDAGSRAKATALIHDVQLPRYTEMVRMIESAKKTSEDEANQLMTDSRKSYTTGNIISVSVGLFVLLFGLLLIIAIYYQIARPLHHMTGVIQKVANGDLTEKMREVKQKDEVQALIKSFNAMIGIQRGLIRDIADVINVLGAASTEISSNTSQLAASSTETATAVSETTATIEEVRQTTALTNMKARQVAESSQRAVQVSIAGKSSTDATVEGMNRIGRQMESIAESIIRLSEQSRAIAEIISSVNDLAEQTNLLAVNASIEAARAGEQGKGFVVVAQEIKNLADQSKQATIQVRTILNDIQNAIGAAVMATEQGSKTVEAGIQQSNVAGDSIHSLAESVHDASQIAIQISASSQEQIVGMDQVALAMENIKMASTQNVSSMRDFENSAQGLREMGVKLKLLIDRFKT